MVRMLGWKWDDAPARSLSASLPVVPDDKVWVGLKVIVDDLGRRQHFAAQAVSGYGFGV